LYRTRHAITATLWDCLALVRATLFQRQQTESYYKKKRRREDEIASRQLRLI